MNRIFRILWSHALNTWVVVSELATSRGKSGGGVDKHGRAHVLMPDRDQVGGSPHPHNWLLQLGALAALLSLYTPAQAVNRFWDVNGTLINRGGTGTWNLSNPFWSTNGDGVSGTYSAWNNIALDDAFFGGTSGTVTLDEPITAHNLTFESTGYTLIGSTLTLSGVTPTINTGNGTATQTINSVILGSAGLTKTGTGTLVLTGNNTYSGDTVISNGNLVVGDGGTTGNVGFSNVTVGLTSTLSINRSDTFTFDRTLSGAGTLAQIGMGTTTLTGLGNQVDNITLSAGTLDVDGSLNTLRIMMSGTSTLNVDGSVQNPVGSNAVVDINSDAGSSTVNVNAGGTLVAAGNLGAGNDVLNVAGTWDARSQVLDLGAGDDSLNLSGTIRGTAGIQMGDGDDSAIFNDGSVLNASIFGDIGVDSAILNNVGALTINVDRLFDFETLQKDGVGEASVIGENAFDSGTVNNGTLTVVGTLDLVAVAIADGAVLNVPGSVGNVSTATVGVGAILNVDGSFTGSAGNDTMAVSGTVSGGGTIDLAGGDDTLTLNDGAALSNVIDGAGHGAGDTVVLNNAGALNVSIANVVNFELLSKNNTGTATLTGNQSFSGGTTLNGGELAVAGALSTPTLAMGDDTSLTVDGSLDAGAGTAAAITGSAGANTVTVNGTALASGDLGAGLDVLDVVGTLDTQGGTFALGDGDDSFVVHDGTTVLGTVDGGAGLDTRVYDINLSADLGSLMNFEGVTKTGTGVLNINAPGATDLQEVSVLGGTLNIGPAGSVTAIAGSPLNTVVAAGATLNVDGSFGCGADNDSMNVAGTVSGSGTIDLCGGEDVLTLSDGAMLNAVVSGGGHGTGDTVVLDNANAFTFDAANTINFEHLQKDNAGVATMVGTQSFSGGITLNAGELSVDGTLQTPTVAMADNTILSIGGSVQGLASAPTELTGSAGVNTVEVAAGASLLASGDLGAGDDVFDLVGTLDTGSGTLALGDGDDRFDSAGTVIGRFEFGAGNDTADFRGGDLSGLTRFDGGAGSEDRANFHGMTLDQADVNPLSNWERVDLLTGTQLTLAGPLNLGNGLLSIDSTSELVGMSGASLTGNLANSGLITVGNARFAISGNYTGGGGLALTVSPGGQNSGGLDIGGDVVGTTAVTFSSDGSETPLQPASIRVISAPNDNAGTVGNFIPADAQGGVVRLNGSVFPWTFDRQSDGWYLNSEGDDILPEIGGYAILPTMGAGLIQESNRLLFQRMAGIRGDTPRCGSHEDEIERAYWQLEGDCQGFWVAATGSELEMGANPGFAFSGDTLGLYVGVDRLLQDRDTRTLRGGLFVAFQHGNYWASGVNSTDLQGIGEANVRVDTPMVGMYGSVSWKNGTYVDMTLVGQLPEATIAVADGFKEEIDGNSLTLSAQLGHRFHLSNGWAVEPQVNLSARAMQWEDKLDASGKQLVMDDDLLGTARVAVRADKSFETAGGARVRPWATLGVQDTLGEKDNALVVIPPGAAGQTQVFPNHELGLMATVDVGVEAELNEKVSLFGVLSYGESLDGSDVKQRQANLGVRIRW
ncbi:ESPR-type extended signal peptide-containing protein [Lysobacter antibioticus]|uniref:ESPR-type extended signal peptide-containing protein n=1 Tax=Lysobacter antibioticus TaxID=84531 RepID=UPI001377FEC2|nr:ESPR-type extended signal peptide-containing protein [Lysobacter antibioticus]